MGTGPRRVVPTRTCVACRTARPKRELLRIVRTPDGRVVEDPTGKAAGRGAYICNDEACRRLAATKGALSRALETPLPAELRASLEAGSPDETMTRGGISGTK